MAAKVEDGEAYVGGAGDELKNSVVFTWAFVEMMCWFWVSWDDRTQRGLSCGLGLRT